MRTLTTLLAIAIAAALLGGCTSAGTAPEEPAATGSMGMAGAGESDGMVAGAIAAEKNASIDTGEVRTAGDKIVVPRVVAPVDGWLVVRSAAATGPVLGVAPLDRGENRDVEVALTAGDSDRVRLAMHVDRGTRGVWEFDPLRTNDGVDRRVYVDRKPVEREVAIAGYGIDTPPHEVSLWVEDQPIGGSLRVKQALAPAGSWIAVHEMVDGVRGRLLGFTGVSGEAFEVDVPIEAPRAATDLAVTLFADRGAAGSFEYAPDKPLTSLDQVLRTGREVVTRVVTVE